jgi:hypothetical protein
VHREKTARPDVSAPAVSEELLARVRSLIQESAGAGDVLRISSSWVFSSHFPPTPPTISMLHPLKGAHLHRHTQAFSSALRPHCKMAALSACCSATWPSVRSSLVAFRRLTHVGQRLHHVHCHDQSWRNDCVSDSACSRWRRFSRSAGTCLSLVATSSWQNGATTSV